MPALIFGIAALLWVGFAAVAMLDPDTFTSISTSLADGPAPLRWLAWILLLPWMAAVAIWEAGWAFGARVAAVGALAIGTLLVLFPKA